MPIPTSAAIYRKIIDKHSINGSKNHKNLLQLLCLIGLAFLMYYNYQRNETSIFRQIK